MNIKLIARYTGSALLFNALFMFLSVVVSMLNGFDSSFSPLLLSALITGMLGSFPFIFVRRSGDVTAIEGFVITFLSWFLSCLFGMLPYLLWGEVFTLSNAWFESVSGYTTTGSTIITNVEALPKGLLMWRSSTHFIGGIGVVVFMLLVLPTMSTFRLRISKIEISSLSKNNYRYRTSGTLRVIAYTYIGINVLCTLSLMLAGMNFFDAVNHAMSIVATGGFSTRNSSILSFDSYWIELVSVFFMYISALHFGLMYMLVVNKSLALFKSPVFRYYTMFLVAVSVLVGINLKFSGTVPAWGMAMRQSFFHVVSICTTTGLATTEISGWPSFSIMLLLIAMIHGSCAGSTTGALKADRVWIFFQALKTQMTKLLHPNAVIPVKVGDLILDRGMVNSALFYIVMYLFSGLAAAVLLAATGLGVTESVSASFSVLGNVGPAFGAGCGSLGNFDDFPTFAKFVMTIEMLLGRLEFYAMLMMFRIFKRN